MASEEPPAVPSTEEASTFSTGTMMSEVLRQEDEFLEYLMSLPRTEPPRPSLPAEQNDSQSKVGLDHLDNLCKLMEQLGELREQNFKLHRRVQYLEDLRAIQDMHRQLKTRIHRQSSEESIQGKTKKRDSEESLHNEETSEFHARARSRSVGPDELPIPPTKAKVSKWTRVKEAFRWEKAQLEPTVTSGGPQLPEAKSQDSGIGLGQDAARSLLLQVPPRNVESSSPADSVLSYSAPMSSSSSSEELMDIDLDFAALSEATDFATGPQRSASASAHSDSVRAAQQQQQQQSRRRSLSPGSEDPDAARRSKSCESGPEEHGKMMLDKKASKTPWGKVKNIIQTRRDSLKRRGPPRPGCSDDEGDDELPRRSREPSGDKRQPPMLTITMPSTEELHSKPPQSPQAMSRAARRSDPHANRVKDIYRRQSSLPRPAGALVGSGTSPPPHRRPSKWTKVKKAFLTSRRDEEANAGVSAVSMPCSPHATNVPAFQFERGGTAALQAEVQRNYEELQSRLSLEFHKKLGEWERRKSHEVVADESVEFRKKLHEWEKIKAKEEEVQPPPVPPPPPPMPPPPPVHYQLSPQFRKRLLEWQIRRAVSGKAGPHEEHELHKGLPEDFTRKLQEWEKIKAGKTSPRLARKDSRNESGARDDKGKVTHKEKQLQWLEKELNKVEREKRRLEREREKFLEREAKLERMRRAMHSPATDSSGEQEVLIQTSTGFFRFHGISEQFTKRLYEWEQQRGIAPEASTFALLDPKFRPEAGDEDPQATAGPSGLVRSKSVGSVADMTGLQNEPSAAELVQSQPSSLSLNDVEALEAELEESRVSSEPRLRSDSMTRPRTDSRSVPRSRSNSRSAPRRAAPPPPPLPPPPLLESPGAMIVDVEDEVEEAASLLRVIPAVRAETPVWSVATPEVTSLALATSGVEDTGRSAAEGGTSVHREDSVRSVSSYQLLEENMQLLSELKHKEAVCRQLEAEMEQLERKLQDVAATQHRQIERLRQEETDRTDDEEQQPPSEERVARLRRSVMELGARRERLQRQGQQLQDSFAEAWQAQAALAQSLVGRARLLRRGMAGEQTSSGSQSPSPGSSRVAIAGSASAACPVVVSCDPPPVLAAVETSPVVDCQDPVVARVEDLSTQLLSLAEKLEHALTSRTREIQSLRSELLRGPVTAGGRERLRPPSGTDSHLSSSLNSLQTHDVELEATSATLNKSFLPRQSSEELAELPHLLTDKVLELKRGLSELCAAAHNRESETSDVVKKDLEHEIHPEPPSADEEIDEAEATTATFVLRVGGWKRGPSESSSSTPIVSGTSVGQGSPTSPVASVTIRPPFWRRVAVDHESSSSESEPGDEGDKSESDDNDDTSPKKVDEEVTCLRKSRTTDDTPNRTLNRTDSKDETNNGGRRCSLRRMSKLISEETRDAWRQHQYVTTVSATATSPEAKKLKTRRVSDTHVAYKSQETKNPNTSEPSSPINVFVPTTRKIFSPVQGKTDESIIGYVISDSSGNIPEKTAESSQVIPWRRRSSTEAENSTKTTTNCVVPWRRTRDSQSASPAMPRKILTGSFSPESSPRARRLHVDAKNEISPLPPPFPRSPTPNRRADQKNNKDGSSSIKLMIAKYNQKLEKPGTPVPISPSYSPAWRSPVAERRDMSGVVRTQMEKYQEEVRRALQQGFSSSRRPTAVQKSASAGVIRCPSASTIPQREPPPLLKSSSAGAIKSPILPLKRIPDIKISSEKLDSEPSSPLDQSIDMTIQAYRKNTMSPKPVSSKTPHSPCMRALKLKRAREEFLTRGPGAFRTSEAGCRLSQASAGSGSSFEDLLLDNEGIVKSASAGMIHVQAEVYKRLTEPDTQDQKPSTSKSESKSKFGLSSLASKFRKVRLRKKERLNTVSMLCRQSLLVDLDDSRRPGSSQDQTKATLKPSTSGKESVSCPNSPVLEHKTIWIKRNKKEK